MGVLLFVVVVALIGAPVFAVMAGATELLWMTHADTAMHHVRFLAPDVMDERFTGNPIMVTVPLFTLIGYLMAESKAPTRIVRAASALFGWMPGGLAVVCIVSSAFFTTLTGGSAVTIVAIGALLYPALLESGYPKNYSLGLVMTGGSLGLLLPPSIPVIIYSFVAGIDYTVAFRALLLPGFFILVVLAGHAAFVATRAGVERTAPDVREMARGLWLIKWEAGTFVLIFVGLYTGLAAIDELAALATAYVLFVEVVVHRDIPLSRLPKAVGNAIALAGAVMLIMAMAMALTNYLIHEQIPQALFDRVTALGMSETWQFLVALNVFLYLQGMVMDGFSSILVAVPLLIPFAAKFSLSPFHLASMFLLNLEIAYLSPPLGQNLFVSSFRFNVPMVRLYRVALPFVGLLLVVLVSLMAAPSISTVAVRGDIERARAEAAAIGESPREAWRLECVQEDRNDPKPCSVAERRRLAAQRAEEEEDVFGGIFE